jgi:hypothetical protein
MKKSRIVSYTSEEVKQLPDESDWAASAAMTDEEIEAAIASDPEEAERHEGWLQRARVVRPQPRYAMCINNKGSEATLTLLRVYKIVSHENAEHPKMMKIVDDTGGESWFSVTCFVPVQLSLEAEKSFELVAVA